MAKKRIDRIGEIRTNKQGFDMQITDYRNNKDIDVVFILTEEKVYHKTYEQFKKGEIYMKKIPAKTKISAIVVILSILIILCTIGALLALIFSI